MQVCRRVRKKSLILCWSPEGKTKFLPKTPDACMINFLIRACYGGIYIGSTAWGQFLTFASGLRTHLQIYECDFCMSLTAFVDLRAPEWKITQKMSQIYLFEFLQNFPAAQLLSIRKQMLFSRQTKQKHGSVWAVWWLFCVFCVPFWHRSAL